MFSLDENLVLQGLGCSSAPTKRLNSLNRESSFLRQESLQSPSSLLRGCLTRIAKNSLIPYEVRGSCTPADLVHVDEHQTCSRFFANNNHHHEEEKKDKEMKMMKIKRNKVNKNNKKKEEKKKKKMKKKNKFVFTFLIEVSSPPSPGNATSP